MSILTMHVKLDIHNYNSQYAVGCHHIQNKSVLGYLHRNLDFVQWKETRTIQGRQRRLQKLRGY